MLNYILLAALIISQVDCVNHRNVGFTDIHHHTRASMSKCDYRMTRCGYQCVDTDSDRSNCGRCNKVCGAGKQCDDGSCVRTDYLKCGRKQVRINGSCVCSPRLEPCQYGSIRNSKNCECSYCKASLVCGQRSRNGVCCKTGELCCPTSSSAGGLNCINPNRDSSNCGTCGKVCSPKTPSCNICGVFTSFASGLIPGVVISVNSDGSIKGVWPPSSDRMDFFGSRVTDTTWIVTFPDDDTFIATITPTGIDWSNDTVWVRSTCVRGSCS